MSTYQPIAGVQTVPGPQASRSTTQGHQLTRLWLVNVIGGIGVLGSYAWGAVTQPDPGRLWGSIPLEMQGPYSAFMPLAAVGYLVVMAWSHGRAKRGQLDSTLMVAMISMLVSSTLWMPASFLALENAALLPVVQVVLGITAVASLVILQRIWRAHGSALRRPALLGALAFCWQTVFLDAVVWPRFFG